MLWMEWLSLFIRWFHVIAGVAWIGASFYFIWLDNNLQSPPQWKKDQGIKGDLWAVHGGGFYEVAKYSYGPKQMPTTLHWFKWEAYTTWISGFALLVLIYYFGASVYLIDPSVNPLSPQQAIIRGLGLIFGGLILYEGACRSPLANSPRLFALIMVIALTVGSYFASQWFSGRGAYIHVGALIGTIMAANVFLQIMPSQRLMVKAVEHNQPIDPKWGEGAKLRSVHNNYFTLPLLFIMISNHYPMTYQHPQGYLVLIAIGLAAAWIRHFFNLKHMGKVRPWVLVSGLLMLLAIAVWVSAPTQTTGPSNAELESLETSRIKPKSELDRQIAVLIETHCVNCHGKNPTDPMFASAPLGLVLDDWQSVVAKAELITQRTAITKDMPFLNKTEITENQRLLFIQWREQLSTPAQ